MAVPLERFFRDLIGIGLMSEDEVRSFHVSVPPEKLVAEDAQELARELIRQKKLTAYQAAVVYQGKAPSLVFGNYVVLDKLGQGGMGMVFKAEHRRMKRLVALKVMTHAAMKSPDAVQRFQREVQAAAKLVHPHIVAAFDADETGGVHFLVMEYVPGSDLGALVKKNGPLPVDKALDYILQAARGLEHAHAEGVVHRDIKPANLLLDKQGTVRILDMGLARLTDSGTGQAAAGLTQSGSIMGTVDFMSPEQALHTKYADRPADIYSLGCSLYYLLTGNPIYAGESLMQKLLAHRDSEIPSLHGARSDVPDAVESVYRRMVAKKPEERYLSMTDVIHDLEACRAGTAVSASASAAQTGAMSSSPWGPASETVGSIDRAMQDFLLAITPAAGSTEARSNTMAPGASDTAARQTRGRASVSKPYTGLQWLNKLSSRQKWLLGGGCAVLLAIVLFALRPSGAPQHVAAAPTSKPKSAPPRETPADGREQSEPVDPAEVSGDSDATKPNREETPTIAADEVRDKQASEPLPVAVEKQPAEPSPAARPTAAATVLTAENREAARKLVHETFKAEYARAKKPGEKQALAETLLKQADQAADGLAAYALLDESRLLFIQAAAVQRAVDVVGRLDTMSDDNRSFAIEIETLKDLEKSARLKDQRPLVVNAGLIWLGEALTVDDFAAANEFSRMALHIARDLKDPSLLKKCQAAARQVQELQVAGKGGAVPLKSKGESRNEPDARVSAALNACLVLGDWERGLKMLRRTGQPEFRRLADLEQQRPRSAREKQVLGDAWWNAAQLQAEWKDRILFRAAVWYEQAWPNLLGPDEGKLSQRLAQIDALPAGISLPAPLAKYRELARRFRSQNSDYDDSFQKLPGGFEWEASTDGIRSSYTAGDFHIESTKPGTWIWFTAGPGTYAYPVIRLVGRVESGGPNDGFGIFLRSPAGHKFSVVLRADGAIEILSWSPDLLGFNAGTTTKIADMYSTVIRQPDGTRNAEREFDALVVAIREQMLAVFVNGRAVGEPIALKENVSPVVPGLAFRQNVPVEKACRTDYRRLTVWQLPPDK